MRIASEKWEVEVDPKHGANLDSVRYDGRPVYRAGCFAEEPFFQGAAMLLPSNRTGDGIFTFRGKTYRLPLNEPQNGCHLHGSLYERSFTVTEQTENQVTMVYENSGACYPFSFWLEVTYRVGEELLQRYRITAREAMPLTFGLHSAFPAPQRFRVPLESTQQKDDRHRPTGRYIPLTAAEQEYCDGGTSEGRVISGYYRSAGTVAWLDDLRMEVSPNFDHWILFNARGERGFLCVEPQAGAVDGLNNGCCTVLEQGETVEFWVKLSVE